MDSEPVQQSFLNWILTALGFPYVILLPLVGLVSFVLTLFIVIRGKGPMAAAALILIVHMPLLSGVFAAIQGTIAFLIVIEMTEDTPHASDFAGGVSTALAAPMVGMLLMIPSYATAALGSFVRSFNKNVEDQ